MQRVDWGAEVIDGLIPHRPPFRFLERIHAWSHEDPFLHGSLDISAGAPIFEGHFPGDPIWPGVCTIEGLAQTCAALTALLGRTAPDGGPGGRSVLGAVNVRLLGPVRPPARLEYRAWLPGPAVGSSAGDALRTFRVEASVGATLVARGTLIASRLPE